MPWNFTPLVDLVSEAEAANVNELQDAITDMGASTFQMFGTHFEPIPFWTNAYGYNTVTANLAYGVKFRVTQPFAATAIQIDINTAGTGNVDANIYTESGGTWTRVVAASTPVSTGGSAGIRTITLAAPANLVPGVDYWVVIVLDNGTAQPLRGQAAANARVPTLNNSFVNKATSYPLPSTFSSPGFNQNWIWCRIVGS